MAHPAHPGTAGLYISREISVAQEKPCISKIRVSKEKNIKKRASQVFLDPIQNRAVSRSVQLEAVYLEALL